MEVANPAQKVVSFGAVSVGSKTTKPVKVVNRSLTPITFTVTIAPSSAAALQQDGMLFVAPTSEITLKANGGSQTIEVTFKPSMRVPSFSEEVRLCILYELHVDAIVMIFQVMLECSGLSRPLFVVTGSCHGIEINLDTNHIPFGAVVLQSQSSRRVLLLNTGDIGARCVCGCVLNACMFLSVHMCECVHACVRSVCSACVYLYNCVLCVAWCAYIDAHNMLYLMTQKYFSLCCRFKWDVAKFKPDFSITPVEGYISPGMEVCICTSAFSTFHTVFIH